MIVLLCAGVHAEDSDVQKRHAFSTRSYRLTQMDLQAGQLHQEVITFGLITIPEVLNLPQPTASADEVRNFIKRSHELLKRFFVESGVRLPPGSLACYDPASFTLAVRTTAETHEMLESLTGVLMDRVPKHLTWMLEIVEAPASVVQESLKEAVGKFDHTEALQKLTAAGKIAVTMRGETKGGVPTTSRQGLRVESASRVPTKLDDASQTERFIGTEFEIDPVLSEAGQMIDFNLRLSHRQASVVPSMKADTGILLADLKSSLMMRSGGTRLLGVWSLDGISESSRAGNMQAAFLRAQIVHLLPSPQPRLEQLLIQHGEVLEPASKQQASASDDQMPAGMIEKRFRVPQDFIQMSSGDNKRVSAKGIPDDPFAANASPTADASPQSHSSRVRVISVEDYFRDQGILFPKGSFARFIRHTREIVVRNLPENVDLVEAFTDSILCCRFPNAVQTTVHILEADAVLLRRLERESALLADHTAFWKALEDEIAKRKARVVRASWIETKGGAQAMFITGIEQAGNRQPEPGQDEEKKKTIASTFSDPGMIGLRLEVDPVLNENGRVDLNIQIENDQLTAGQPAASHEAFCKISTTLQAGVPRLLSLYQPASVPGQTAEVLHAVFIRSDVVRVD